VAGATFSLRGRRSICVAGAAFILRDVAESDEKENEGRTNAGPSARSKGSFQMRFKRDFPSLGACVRRRHFCFVTKPKLKQTTAPQSWCQLRPTSGCGGFK